MIRKDIANKSKICQMGQTNEDLEKGVEIHREFLSEKKKILDALNLAKDITSQIEEDKRKALEEAEAVKAYGKQVILNQLDHLEETVSQPKDEEEQVEVQPQFIDHVQSEMVKPEITEEGLEAEVPIKSISDVLIKPKSEDDTSSFQSDITLKSNSEEIQLEGSPESPKSENSVRTESIEVQVRSVVQESLLDFANRISRPFKETQSSPESDVTIRSDDISEHVRNENLVDFVNRIAHPFREGSHSPDSDDTIRSDYDGLELTKLQIDKIARPFEASEGSCEEMAKVCNEIESSIPLGKKPQELVEVTSEEKPKSKETTSSLPSSKHISSESSSETESSELIAENELPSREVCLESERAKEEQEELQAAKIEKVKSLGQPRIGRTVIQYDDLESESIIDDDGDTAIEEEELILCKEFY